MVSRVGPLATIRCEPRQTWKGAAVAADSCAEVRLARPAAQFIPGQVSAAEKGIG